MQKNVREERKGMVQGRKREKRKEERERKGKGREGEERERKRKERKKKKGGIEKKGWRKRKERAKDEIKKRGRKRAQENLILLQPQTTLFQNPLGSCHVPHVKGSYSIIAQVSYNPSAPQTTATAAIQPLPH